MGEHSSYASLPFTIAGALSRQTQAMSKNFTGHPWTSRTMLAKLERCSPHQPMSLVCNQFRQSRMDGKTCEPCPRGKTSNDCVLLAPELDFICDTSRVTSTRLSATRVVKNDFGISSRLEIAGRCCEPSAGRDVAPLPSAAHGTLDSGVLLILRKCII